MEWAGFKQIKRGGKKMSDSYYAKIEMTPEFIENMDEYTNLILNLMSGLDISDLTDSEIELLKDKHGENWKQELGYE